MLNSITPKSRISQFDGFGGRIEVTKVPNPYDYSPNIVKSVKIDPNIDYISLPKTHLYEDHRPSINTSIFFFTEPIIDESEHNKPFELKQLEVEEFMMIDDMVITLKLTKFF